MEAIRSSETSVHTRSTQRHIPEDGILLNNISFAKLIEVSSSGMLFCHFFFGGLFIFVAKSIKLPLIVVFSELFSFPFFQMPDLI
jgi:hypothetical protein